MSTLFTVHISSDEEFYDLSRRGCDRMVVGFTTTCAISAYQH